MARGLAHKHILVVEDDYLVAQQIVRALRAEGAEVIGPAPSADSAIAMTESNKIDAALLDIHLRESMAYPIADVLISKGVPFLFSTAYDPATIPARYAEIKVYEKPQENSVLLAALLDALPVAGTAAASWAYSIRQEGDFWRWELTSDGETVDQGGVVSSLNARFAAMAAGLRRFR